MTPKVVSDEAESAMQPATSVQAALVEVCGICAEPFTIPAEEGDEDDGDQDLDGE